MCGCCGAATHTYYFDRAERKYTMTRDLDIAIASHYRSVAEAIRDRPCSAFSSWQASLAAWTRAFFTGWVWDGHDEERGHAVASFCHFASDCAAKKLDGIEPERPAGYSSISRSVAQLAVDYDLGRAMIAEMEATAAYIAETGQMPETADGKVRISGVQWGTIA